LLVVLMLLAGCTAAPQTAVPGEAPQSPSAGVAGWTATPDATPTHPKINTEASPEASATPLQAVRDPLADTETPLPSATPLPIDVPTRENPMGEDDWQSLPVIPPLTERQLAVLRYGLEMGANPQAFSKIGDCESRTSWFLGDFDLGPQHYALGPYEEELAPVVAYYQGSFNRLSLAAKPGYSAASLLSTLWSDPEFCNKGESPLACEYRVHRPALAFILLGTNDASNPATFEGHMRRIIEFSLSQGVLPIIGTKADNVEGNHALNRTMAALAYEYDVPLWNFWAAAQSLLYRGLQRDGLHLTYAENYYDVPRNLRFGWPQRNLGAMQMLRLTMDAANPDS